MNTTDPTTWNYPVIVGVVGPSMNISSVVRELTDDERAKLEDYRKICSDARNRFKLFTILQRNYAQWSNYIQSLLKPGEDLSPDEMVELDRLLLNFLSSAKSVLDHFRQHWTQAHRSTPKNDAFKEFIRKLEQGSWAFRLLPRSS